MDGHVMPLASVAQYLETIVYDCKDLFYSCVFFFPVLGVESRACPMLDNTSPLILFLTPKCLFLTQGFSHHASSS